MKLKLKGQTVLMLVLCHQWLFDLRRKTRQCHNLTKSLSFCVHVSPSFPSIFIIIKILFYFITQLLRPPSVSVLLIIYLLLFY